MPTRKNKLELAGLNEVAAILGRSKQRTSQIRRTDPDFPQPLDEVSAGPIWNTADIRSYAKKKGMAE